MFCSILQSSSFSIEIIAVYSSRKLLRRIEYLEGIDVFRVLEISDLRTPSVSEGFVTLRFYCISPYEIISLITELFRAESISQV